MCSDIRLCEEREPSAASGGGTSGRSGPEGVAPEAERRGSCGSKLHSRFGAWHGLRGAPVPYVTRGCIARIYPISRPRRAWPWAEACGERAAGGIRRSGNGSSGTRAGGDFASDETRARVGDLRPAARRPTPVRKPQAPNHSVSINIISAS